MDKKPTTKDISLLVSRPDLADKFDEIYGAGTAKAILQKANPQFEGKPSSTSAQYAGAVTRGLAGPMLGAAMGAPLGPVGMLAGSLAVPAGDALTMLVNAISSGVGSDKRLTSPSQGIQQLLTRAGVAQPETAGQRMVEAGAGAIGGTAAQLPGLMRMAGTGVTQMGRNIASQMAERPVAQLATAIPAGAVAQRTAEAVQPYLGDTGAMLAGMAGGVATGGASMASADRVKRAMSNAEQRAANIAAKAQGLGFEGQTALTPGQAGTSKTAQIFEAAASTLPGSAGQFTRRYSAQADLAEGIFGKIADMFGGLPQDPSVAYSGGASAVRTAAKRNVDKIGQGIRSIASQSDINLADAPKFQDGIMNARKLLQSLPPKMRQDPLFESFEQFYFGAKNEALDAKVADAMAETGMKPTNPNFKAFADKVRQQLIDGGEPEFSFQGYAQKGAIPGADYQDQRVLFGDLAYQKRGTQIGEAFKSLRNALDNARDDSFKAQGLEDQVTELRNLRASYGSANELNNRFATAGDKTVLNTLTTNKDSLARSLLPLLNLQEKQLLAQGVLSDIYTSSLNKAGELDITKLGSNVIKANKVAPVTFDQIFGTPAANQLVDLADVAQTSLKPKIGSSQTSERSMMINLLTSGPAKLATIVGGSAAMGIPLASAAAGLAAPAIASKAYLSPRVQNFYEGLNISDPLMNYLSSPVDPMLRYAASPNLLNIVPEPEPYRIDINGVGQLR
jgi:hypothetical protein